MAPAKMELRNEGVGALALVAAPTARGYAGYHLEAFGDSSAGYLRKRAIRESDAHADRPDEIASTYPEGPVGLNRPGVFPPARSPAGRPMRALRGRNLSWLRSPAQCLVWHEQHIFAPPGFKLQVGRKVGQQLPVEVVAVYLHGVGDHILRHRGI